MAPKALRLDAERNRKAILAAAAIVYADRGTDTSLDEVAQLAGVGVGTVYRRFPNKALLIEALLEDSMRAYAELAEDAARRVVSEPWEAFRDHVGSLVDMQARDRAFSEVVSDPGAASPAFREFHRRALQASMTLVAVAKRAEVLRDDFQHRDLIVLIHAAHGVVSATRPGDSAESVRFAELFLDAVHRLS